VAVGIPNWLQVMGILAMMSSMGSDLAGFGFGISVWCSNGGLRFGLVLQWCIRGDGRGGVGGGGVVWLVWCF